VDIEEVVVKEDIHGLLEKLIELDFLQNDYSDDHMNNYLLRYMLIRNVINVSKAFST
jgi:hypothetical protein